MQPLAASAVLAGLMAGEPHPSWDLAKCQQALTEAKAKAGHACTPEHLGVDLAQLRKFWGQASTTNAATTRVLREQAETGVLEELRQASATDAATTRVLREQAETGALQELAEAAAKVQQSEAGPKQSEAGLTQAEAALKQALAELKQAEAPVDRKYAGAGLANADDKVPYPLSGNALLSWCERYDGKRFGAGDALCAGYVQGVTDAMSLFDYTLEFDGGGIEALTSRRSCIPTGTTYEQHIRVIAKYLRDHPEQLHRNRFVLALTAVRTGFPCPKEK